MLIFEKFPGGIAPRPPYWGGATAPLPRPQPPSALRASTPRSGPSVPPSSVLERFSEILAPELNN